jgi:ParB/RepB/Spo0J family partition protein
MENGYPKYHLLVPIFCEKYPHILIPYFGKAIMSDTRTFKRKTVLKEVAIALIWPNPENPRSFADPEAVKTLAASMKNTGQRSPVKLVLLTDAEKAAIGSPYEYKLLGGHMRREAALSLGWETLDAMILELTPEEAELEMDLDNVNAELPWLDRYKIIERHRKKDTKVSQEVIGGRLGVDQSTVSRALQTLQYLTPASRTLIYEILIKSKGDIKAGEWLTIAITELEDPEKVEKALKVAFDRHLIIAQAKGLVAHVKAGNPPETHTGHKAPSPKKASGISTRKGSQQALPDEVLAKVVELAKKAGVEEAKGDGQTVAQEELKAHLADLKKPTASAVTSEPPQLQPISRSEGLAILGQQIGKAAKWLTGLFKPKEPKEQPKASGSTAAQHFGHTELKALKPEIKWTKKVAEWFAKIAWRDMVKLEHRFFKKIANYIVPVKHFKNSNHTHSGSNSSSGPGPLVPTVLHWFVYCLLQLSFWWFSLTWVTSRFVPALKPLVQWPFRFLAHEFFTVLFNWVWPGILHDWVVALVVVVAVFGIINAAKAQPQRMAFLGIVIAGLWFFGRGWSSAFPSLAVTDPPTPQPTPLVASASRPPVEKRAVSAPISPKKEISVKPFVEGAETQNYFDEQLKIIPLHSLIMAYTFQPDYNMGSDMAYHRLMDLQLREKYTVLWGTDKETVTTITCGASNLALTMNSGLGVFLDGPTNVNIYWENVKTFCCDVIKTTDGINTKTTYEIFLVLEDSKKPLAIQCATAADLEHLVSALEFYIKLSGHNAAPIGSLPYLNQGLLMNKDREVIMLWADSPVGKTALTFGDNLWSVGTNKLKQQTKAELETALQSPATGLTNLYFVKPVEWKRALKDSDPDNPDSFYAKRQKVSLQVQ